MQYFHLSTLLECLFLQLHRSFRLEVKPNNRLLLNVLQTRTNTMLSSDAVYNYLENATRDRQKRTAQIILHVLIARFSGNSACLPKNERNNIF